jgi:glycosyltransferase involved in cell wall biosynthesis
MKILLVHNQYQQPGGEDIVFEQERRLLQRAGHQVVVYQRSNEELEQYSLRQRLMLAKSMVSAKDTQREFARLLAREQPQVVHIHNTFVMVSPSVYLTCQRAGVPVVQTLHNYRLFCPAASLFRSGHVCEECIDHNLLRSVRHACYRKSRSATAAVALMVAVHRHRRTWDTQVNAYIALTEFARQKFIAGGLPPERIFVKPNFVHPDPGGHLSTGEHAVFAGRLSAEKAVSTLLAAWSRLGRTIPLLILGDGPERKKLELQAANCHLSSVSFQGQRSREDAWAALAEARFLIMPSECYETFNLTSIEAFACATPVICSRIGALQELVEDGRTGLHFTPGNADDLAAKVEWAWTHPAQMKAMGQAARLEFEAKFTAERNYDRLAEIYQYAVESRGHLHLQAPQLTTARRDHVRNRAELPGEAASHDSKGRGSPEERLDLSTAFSRPARASEFSGQGSNDSTVTAATSHGDLTAQAAEPSSAARAVHIDSQSGVFQPAQISLQLLDTRAEKLPTISIVNIHNGYEYAGGEDFVAQAERNLMVAAAHRVIEYRRYNAEIRAYGLLSRATLGARTIWAWDSCTDLRRLLRCEKPDLAHFHNTFPLISPAAYYACREAGVPVVQSLHNPRLLCPAATLYRNNRVCEDCLGRTPPWPGILHGCYQNSRLRTGVVATMLTVHRWLGTWQSQVDVFVVFTEFYRKKFIEAGLPAEKIMLKPHFVYPDPGSRTNAGDYALFLGRLAPEKGVRTLLLAWRRLGNRIPLLVVGDGPLRAELEAEVAKRGLSTVRFVGYVSEAEKSAAFRAARFLVWPSEGYYETFGLVALEAFAHGVPVIASRTGAMAEIVEDGHTGLNFLPGDADDLAAKVEWAWSHPNDVETMGRNARLQYKTKYTAKRNYEMLMEIYQRAIAARA